MEADEIDDGIARAGAAVAARRLKLKISQRELARRKVITAPSLIGLEKGRLWPRERSRHALEQCLQWPAGTIARIRAGGDPPAETLAPPTPAVAATKTPAPPGGSADAILVVDALELALDRFDTAIDDLPAATSPDFPSRALSILTDLRKLEALAIRAMRHSQGSPAEVVKSLGHIRGRYDDLMLKAAAHPDATLGQRLYAVRRRANLVAGEAAVVGGIPVELVESAEAGEVLSIEDAARVESLIDALASP
ncbi:MULTISPECIES: transcriptional regulator [Mycolicibacterium]|uniref:transcriptional regulator n=1 Tax=Mycolicibacterium TaxID=1866885 RepID=UPI0021F2E943|nr:transcriptional regulator [Mycolicibacterium pyrenivorans]